MNELDITRKNINEIDEKMAELFEQRMKEVEKVAAYKAERGLPVLDETREKAVVEKNAVLVKDELIREYYVNFIKGVTSLSRDYQTRLSEGMKVAYSGLPGAYAEIAAKKLFPSSTAVPYGDFKSAYKAVEDGECDVAVLPIENSFAGDVGTVLDLIFSGPLYVNQVTELAIKHNLVAVKGATRDGIKRVISHGQAISQCSEYLRKRGLTAEEATNTAVAAKYVADLGDKSVAAIAAEETAELYGLEVVDSGINTSAGNTTRFAVFSRVMREAAKGSDSDNFILTFTVKNEAGALAKTLDIIGSHGYNMRNLRSRPMKELLWNYYFYVEAEGNINSEDGKDMLRELGATCDKLRLAGTYSAN